MIYLDAALFIFKVRSVDSFSQEQRKTNVEVVTRLTAVEASAKQAHKRLDAFESRERREHEE